MKNIIMCGTVKELEKTMVLDGWYLCQINQHSNSDIESREYAFTYADTYEYVTTIEYQVNEYDENGDAEYINVIKVSSELK